MSGETRLLVCGGRDFADKVGAYKVLDAWHRALGIGVVIEGDARGADRIAGYWARKNRVDNLKFPADWNTLGKAAGAIRNQQMLDEGKPTHVLAFPGGRGTADMVRRAKAAGVQVIKVGAQRIEARSDETPTAAQPVGREPGPKDAPNG
jgi:hypothetical protein